MTTVFVTKLKRRSTAGILDPQLSVYHKKEMIFFFLLVPLVSMQEIGCPALRDVS